MARPAALAWAHADRSVSPNLGSLTSHNVILFVLIEGIDAVQAVIDESFIFFLLLVIRGGIMVAHSKQVRVGYFQVLRFTPTAQRHAARLIGGNELLYR